MKINLNQNKYKLGENSRGVDLEYNTPLDVIDIIKRKSPYYYEMIKGGFIPEYQKLFRGTGRTYYKPVRLYTPKSHKRQSVNTENYYTEILDNSKYWKDYPNRGSSIIATTDFKRAGIYGTVYHVIPLIENSIIAIAPTYDIWLSFEFALNKLNDLFKEDKLIKNSRDEFDTMGGFNNFLRIKFGVDKKGDYNEIKKKLFLNDDVFSSLDRESTFDNSRFIYNKEELLKIQNKWGTFMNYIEYLLSPKWNEFTKVYYNKKVVLPDNREVWTDDDCLLIEHELHEKLLMMLS